MKIVTKRKIDELGRIVLPIELRRYFNLSKDDIVDIRATKYDIIVSKATEQKLRLLDAIVETLLSDK